MGKIIDDHNPKHLASTISEVLVNDELLEELKKNCKIASQHENWEKEKKKLKQYFP